MAPRMGSRRACVTVASACPSPDRRDRALHERGGPARRRVRDVTQDTGGTCLIALGDGGHDTRPTELP